MRRRFIYNYKIDIPNDEIWYTSTNSNIVTPYSTIVFGANIVSNTYSGGKGIIKFDGDITSIGEWAFYRCSSLTSITIPDSVTTIGNLAFYDCTSLTRVTIPNGVTMIGERAFTSCLSLTSVTIPDSVTTIGESAFARCPILTNVTIPNGVTTIENYTFSECTSLTSITIHDNITLIGGSAFYKCTSLTSVTIPDSVILIRYTAFASCLNLKSVYCKATIPPTLGSDVFNNNATDRKIYVPYQSLNAYKTAEYWSDYADDIVGYDFENDVVVGGVITFTVAGVQYQAEDGMTWADFYCSDYNNDLIAEGLNPPKDIVHNYPEWNVCTSKGFLMNNSTNSTVKFGDKIDNLGVYTIDSEH